VVDNLLVEILSVKFYLGLDTGDTGSGLSEIYILPLIITFRQTSYLQTKHSSILIKPEPLHLLQVSHQGILYI
tara:strand:- start:3074 stop:3292 length:219 start_codon:yes stop_codon:yes gene_type:complete